MSSRREFLTIISASLLIDRGANTPEIPLQIIVVKTRTEADEIVDRLKKGRYFNYLAKQYSVDPSSQEGGYVGRSWGSNSQLHLEALLPRLDPGQTGPIIVTPQGYVIVRALSELEVAWFEHIRLPNELVPPARREYDPVTYLCGGMEADTFFAGLAKPPGFEQNLQTNCDCWRQAIRGGFGQTEKFLSDLANQNPLDPDTMSKQMHGHFLMGQVLCYLEKMDQATQISPKRMR